jgi:GDP-mannose 6-dehydrogenase
MGSNREYIEREIPHIWSLMRGSVEEVIESSEVIVIGNGSGEFRRIEPKLRSGQIVIDLVRAFGDRMSNGDGYRGICW